jgi:uncharacterized protein YkwD
MDTLRALRVLGLPLSANAEDIGNAWRDLAKVWHPDRFPHDARLRQKAGNNLQRINEAHEVLRDYDPTQTPRLASRVRESVAIILGMGELGDPAPYSHPVRPPPELPREPSAPIGARRSWPVLGLGIRREGSGTSHHHAHHAPWRGWLLALLIVIVLAMAVVSLLQSQQPDPTARSMVDEINRLRTDPAGYAALLEQTLPLYAGTELRRPGRITIRTSEGATAVREAIAALRAQAPLAALELSDGLSRAAADHVQGQGPAGATGHDGSDGSSMRSRIERYGQWGGGISENIDYGSAEAREVVMSLVVDDGVTSRGHRRNLLDPGIRLAGAACGSHQRYRTMCVVDHAGSFTPNAAVQAGAGSAPPGGGKPRRAPPSGMPRPR